MKFIFLFFILLAFSHANNVNTLTCMAQSEFPETQVNHTAIINCEEHMYKYRRCIEVNQIAVWEEVHECQRIPLLYDKYEFVLIKDKYTEIIPIISDNIDAISINHILPMGMELDVKTGKISGKAVKTGYYDYIINTISENITYKQQMKIIVLSNEEIKSNNNLDNNNNNGILIMSLVIGCVAIVGVIVGITVYTRSITKRVCSVENKIKVGLINEQI